MSAPLNLRLARRELLRHKLRSLLVVLLVAVPVAAGVGLWVNLSHESLPQSARILGSLNAAARIEQLQGADGTCLQTAPDSWSCDGSGDTTRRATQADLALAQRLLPGTEVETVGHDGSSYGVGGTIVVVDLSAPHAGDRYYQPPAAPGPGEVLIDASSITYGDLAVGDEVQVLGGRYRIAGAVRMLGGSSPATRSPRRSRHSPTPSSVASSTAPHRPPSRPAGSTSTAWPPMSRAPSSTWGTPEPGTSTTASRSSSCSPR